MKDDKSDIDLPGPTLLSLEALLENPPKPDQRNAASQFTRMVHAVGVIAEHRVFLDRLRLAPKLFIRRGHIALPMGLWIHGVSRYNISCTIRLPFATSRYATYAAPASFRTLHNVGS
ncbi:hypothetical protein BD410DRAFT_384661 [Rickenella mellea]|uniref:Uncharacterized protein n=1 Tax=Rickenella mellea TaxID=50990 RepID=A0A4Y7PZ51_9AGAM|nr:hypothetical protein BD410DRAFT_384661 [Rickenella mellea]